MKQTNNAIKFLMAQYRAIFRNANLKMFLAAATAAAALSATQVNAAAIKGDKWADLTTGSTISEGTETFKTSGKAKANFDLTVSGEGKLAFQATTVATPFEKGDSMTGSILLNGENASITVGNATNGAKVVIDSFTATAGTLTIGGHDTEASSLEADNIILGGDATEGTPVTVKLGKSGALGGASSTVSLTTGAKLTLEAQADKASIAGEKLIINGGDLVVDGAKNLTISSKLVDVKEKSTFSNGTGTVTFDKATSISFAKDTLTNGGKISLGTIGGGTPRNVLLKVDAEDFNTKLFKGAALQVSVSGDAGGAGTLTINAEGEAELNLKDSGLFAADGSGKIDVAQGLVVDATNKTNVNLKLLGKNASLATTKLADSDLGNVELQFDTLTLGDGQAEFSLEASKATVTVKNGLTVSGDKNLVITSGSTLNLSGAGAVAAGSVKVGDTAGSQEGKLNISNGAWTMNDLDIQSGTVALTNNATLSINDGKALKVAKAQSLTADNSTIDASKAGVTAVNEESAIKLTNGASVIFDAADIFSVESDGSVKVASGDGTAASKFTAKGVSGDGTTFLQLNMKDTVSADLAAKIKTAVAETGFDGFIDFGDKIEAFKDPTVDYDKMTSGVNGMYSQTQVIMKTNDIDKGTSAGSIKLAAGGTDINVQAGQKLILAGASTDVAGGMFVQTSDGKLAGVTLADNGSAVTLNGEGKVGAISATKDKSGSVTIGGQKNGNGIVTVAGNVGAKGQALGSLTVNSGSTLVVEATKSGDATLQDVYTQSLALNKGSSLQADGQTITITGTEGSKLEGNLSAKELTLTDKTANLTIAGDAVVELESLTLASTATGMIQLGKEGADGTTGTLDVDKLTLNGGTLLVDPDFDKGLAIAHVKAFNAQAKSTDGGKDAQIVDGNIIVGKNSVAAIGFETRDDVMSLLDSYGYLKTHENGTINLDSGEGIQAALVLDDPIKIASGNGVLIDPSKTGSALGTPTDNTFKMDGQGALIINDSVYVRGTDGQLKGAAVTLAEGDTGAVEVNGNSKVILAGAFSKADKGIQVFKSEKGGVTEPVKAQFTIETANGIFKAEVDKNGTVSEFSFMDGAEEKFKSFYKQSSAPVEQLLKDTFLGELAVDRNYAGANLVLAAANDKDDHTGVKADAAAHAATYAGAQIAAVAAVGSMADAVGGRVGAAGVESAVVAATGSQANGGVWLSPIYKSVDADGFNAQGASYGADVDLAGVAFGTDTVNGNMRFGAVFNIGSGDADGKGNGNGLKDEFDYYGFGMYTVMGFGNFALVGDASLNVISHDVSGESGLKDFGKLKGSADTTAVTMGVTGQYTISNPAVDVTPHVGARFIRLDTDSYDLVSDKGTVATTDYDVQNVFSIPLGVTLSKAFEMGGWSLAPSADLTLTFNTGDTEVNSNTKFTGVNRNLGLTTEVLDEVTYGVAVGLGAQYGAFGTNIGINYTGSSNTDAFGVNAQARYMF